MTASIEIVTLQIDDDGLDPVTVYGTLRTFTPGRGSFLLESLEPSGDAGRYSVVGYRVRTGEMLPPGIDTIRTQLDTFRAMDAPAQLAESLAHAAVGYIAYEATHGHHGIRRWDDEVASGCFLVGSVVVLFDHHENTVTVAGPKAGRVAERCAWELRNGPRPGPSLPVVDPPSEAMVAKLRPLLGEDQLAARAARAQRYLLDPVERLALAQTFSAPIGEADGFEIYRALRQETSEASGFFVDFGISPVGPTLQLLGTAAHPLTVVRGDGDFASPLRDCFPHPRLVGEAPVDAARIIRRLEDGSRELLGSLVGYFTPGGGGAFALAERPVAVRGDYVEVQVAVPIDRESDATSTPARALAAVQAELAAVAAVQRGR